MKKQLLTLLFAFVSIMYGYSQEDMKVVWEKKLDHDITYHGTDLSGKEYSYAANDKEMTVFKTETGEVIWTSRFKDLAPKLKKIDELIPFWESHTVFLFDRKTGKDQIACVDFPTGKVLWTTDKYQNVTDDNVVYIPEKEGFAISLKDAMVFVKVKTGEETWSTSKFKGSVGKYLTTDDGYMIMINYKPTLLASLFSGFKNQIVKINLTNGDIEWEGTYIGIVEKKVINKEALVDIELKNEKIILKLNGIQVYDYKTGANLWSAAFDYTPNTGVKPPGGTRKFGIYGAVADPVIVNDEDMYVLDMKDKKNQYVKKYDLGSGKLLWTSSEIKGARAIPNMRVIDDKVVLQIGGAVEAQAYIVSTSKSGNMTYTYKTWKVWFPEVKPMGIQAFNASDGTLAWDSEKFKKGITNSIDVEGNFIVCSGKSLYSLDAKTGGDNYEVPVSKGGVGHASLIVPYKDMIVVVGEKGVSTFKASNGELVASGKYKTASPEDLIDNILILKTDKADIAAFDLNTCKYKQFKAKTGAGTSLTEDGKFVYVYEKKVVSKVSTE